MDKDYKVTISDKRVHIMNYEVIEDFSNTRVVIRYNKGRTVLLGTDLVVTKMQDEELLITGKLKSIEYN